MDYLSIIPAVLMFYYVLMVIRHPDHWLSYFHLLPVIVFMFYAHYHGIGTQSRVGAFELAGVVAVAVTAILWQQNMVLDRIMLGLNSFFIIGAIGILFDNEQILQWYSSGLGGPLFGNIAFVGIATMAITKIGFIGVAYKNSEVTRYGSFLLLAATFIAFVWAISAESEGLLWAIIIPFVSLCLMRHWLRVYLLH